MLNDLGLGQHLPMVVSQVDNDDLVCYNGYVIR